MRVVPLVVLGLFALVDGAANWRAFGMVPVSVELWALPWPVRFAAAAVMVVLAAHLALRWPYG